jgi:hypothetical protein
MKLAKFLLVLSAVEKGSAFVIKNHETGEITSVKPEAECINKIGGLCITRKTKKHNKTAGKESDISSQHGASSSTPNEPMGEMNPIVGYALTKDKQYIDLAMAGHEFDQSNPAIQYLAAKNLNTNPQRAYALTKDPNMFLADDIVKDPTLAIHAAQNSDADPVTNQDLIMNKFLNKGNDPAMMLALTGNPILAHAQKTGNKLPLYSTIGGNPELGEAYVAATIKDPLEIYSLTGNRQAMYAAKTKDPTLSLTAQEMNNPTFAYGLTGDPILALQKPDPTKPDHKPVNPLMAYYVAGKGDVNLAYAMTGDSATAYASGLPADRRQVAAMAPGMTHNPLMMHLMTKDPVMTLESVAHAQPDSPMTAYMAAMTGDPSMATALTGDPTIGYAAQTTKPGIAGMALQQDNPAMAYYATKDKLAMAMASDNPMLQNYAAATSASPQMAYAVTGNLGTLYAAQEQNPGKTVMYQQMGSPMLTYLGTKNPALAMTTGLPSAKPAEPAVDGTPAADESEPTTFEPLFSGEAQPADAPISYLAANSGNPMMSLGLTNNPTVYLASQNKNPTLALAAANLNNPAATYMLTKDPVLTMMAQAGQQESGEPVQQFLPTEPVAANTPLSYIAANSGNSLMSLGLTNNPTVYLASQNKNPTLALAAANMNNPAATYLLTKDPVLTMMSQQGQQPAAPAKPADPLTTLALSKVNNLTPALAYGVTNDPNMIMHGQWDNKNLALANAINTNSDPVSNNPTMDLIAAHTLTDPTTSYALTGNPLIAHAVGAGKGKEVAGLMAGQAGNPIMTYALTKDPKLAYLSTQQNPLLSYTALQHSPAMAAVATNNPMMFLLKQN